MKVLKTVSDYDLNEDVVLGQYRSGRVQGEDVPGYLDESDVPDDSTTETYAAVRLHLENWRWKGVPFYLCTGKRLPEKSTRVEIRFREPPVCFFESFGSCQITANKLILTLQPDEGFELYFEVKKPGEPLTLQSYPLNFEYADVFDPIPDAYSTLLHDIMQGDQTLFVRSDEVEAAWSLYEPILNADLPVHGYDAGSRGPDQALKMLPF